MIVNSSLLLVNSGFHCRLWIANFCMIFQKSLFLSQGSYGVDS